MDERFQRVDAALRAQGAELISLTPLYGGACQENFKAEVKLEGQPVTFALRSDARSTLPGSLKRVPEYAVVQAAVKAGVKTPEARWLTRELLRPGADAYFLAWIRGEAIGRRVVKSPELAEARKSLPGELARSLAALHRVTPTSVTLPFAPPREAPAQVALGALLAMRERLPGTSASLEVGLRWLRDHVPTGEETVLVHGDFRTGNFMVSPSGLEGILDWEFAHWGSPLEDLAWVCVRDWRFNQLDLPVGGFGKRAPFFETYSSESGRAVDRAQLRWWEVYGNLRWAVGSLFQGQRYLSGEDRDLELIAIAKRHVEMEFEALRLIERGLS